MAWCHPSPLLHLHLTYPYRSGRVHLASYGLEVVSFAGPAALPAGPLPQHPAPTTPAMPLAASSRSTPSAPAQTPAPGSSPPDLSYTSLTAPSVPASPLPPPAAAAAPRTTTPSAPYTRSSAPPTDMEVEVADVPITIGTATTPPPPNDSMPPPLSSRAPAAPRAMDVDTNASSTSPAHDFPHQPVDDDTKRMLIAPLVIPSRSPKPSSLPTTTSAEKQSLLTCYAGLFARLPSLGRILNSQFHHAQELYNHLFAPSVPVANPDNPNSAFHQTTPPGTLLLPSPILSLTLLTPLWTSHLL